MTQLKYKHKIIIRFLTLFNFLVIFLLIYLLLIPGVKEQLKSKEVKWIIHGKVFDENNIPIQTNVMAYLGLSSDSYTQTTRKGEFHLQVNDMWHSYKRTYPTIMVCKDGYYPVKILYDRWDRWIWGTRRHNITIRLIKNPANGKGFSMVTDMRAKPPYTYLERFHFHFLCHAE